MSITWTIISKIFCSTKRVELYGIISQYKMHNNNNNNNNNNKFISDRKFQTFQFTFCCVKEN